MPIVGLHHLQSSIRRTVKAGATRHFVLCSRVAREHTSRLESSEVYCFVTILQKASRSLKVQMAPSDLNNENAFVAWMEANDPAPSQEGSKQREPTEVPWLSTGQFIEHDQVGLLTSLFACRGVRRASHLFFH